MLTVQDLHKSYQVGKTTYEVLKGVSLEVGKGEFVAVMGPSGSGKTTLLNCISCYIPSDAGSILLGDTELDRLDEDALAQVRNRQLGFVFQDFLLLDGLTVRENILLPATIGGTVSAMTEARADQLCDVFGISAIRDTSWSRCSTSRALRASRVASPCWNRSTYSIRASICTPAARMHLINSIQLHEVWS